MNKESKPTLGEAIDASMMLDILSELSLEQMWRLRKVLDIVIEDKTKFNDTEERV